MGTAPASTSYLLVGDGRAARHFRRYLQLESIPFTTWIRGESLQALETKTAEANRTLLLISDDAIESFYAEHPFFKRRMCVHFSGRLFSEAIYGAHPLMLFSGSPYDLETYRSIPFILEKGRRSMAELLPGLKNPSFEIDAREKTFYHALCSMTGNFTVLLWEKAFREFQHRLQLPKEALIPYLRQVCENLARSAAGESVLTGPLRRNDTATIDRHLLELRSDPFADVYLAFVKAYRGGRQ